MDNALKFPSGVGSALGNDADGNAISVLGVPPNATVTDTTGADLPPSVPPFSFMDAPAATSGLDSALGKVFWRGRVRESCELTIEQPDILPALRQRCIGSAVTGGDTAACTACVELAELHIPTCEFQDSKCSTIGVVDVDLPPSTLPASWFDTFERTLDEGYCNHTPEFVAMLWCSDTLGDAFSGNTEGTRWLQHFEEGPICSTQLDPGFRYGEAKIRRAFIQRENFPNAPALFYDSTRQYPYVPYRVNVFEETLEAVPFESDPCDEEPPFTPEKTRTTSSLDPLVQQQLGLLPIWYDYELGIRALQNPDQLKSPGCGIQQRIGIFNQTCDTVAGLVLGPPIGSGPYNPATGSYHFDTLATNACYVAEPRRVGACPSGQTCTSSGECIAERCTGTMPNQQCEPQPQPSLVVFAP